MAAEADPLISAAMVRYIGHGLVPYPQRDMGRATAPLDDASRAWVVPMLEAILHFADRVDPDWAHHDLWAGSCHIARRTQREFPLLDEAAAMALAWAFSYWNR